MTDYTDLFPNLPGDSDVWVYTASRILSDKDSAELTSLLSQFASDWSSHGRMVDSGFKVINKQLVLLGANIPGGDISGCGIDKSLQMLTDFSRTRDFQWVDSLSIVYRNSESELSVESRAGFRTKVASGEVTADTVVVDTSLRLLDSVRTGMLELKSADSWHGRLFRIPAHSTV